MNARLAGTLASSVFLAACAAPPAEQVDLGSRGQPVAVTLPGFVDSVVAQGIVDATSMVLAPDGRIFVTQQSGALRVIKGNALLPAPFVTLPVTNEGERGLLGVEVDPDFLTNHFVYLYYTATTPTVHNRISRFVASGDEALPNGETIILELEDLSAATIHNGGALHFGGDGKLYVAVGDNANGPLAQSMNSLFGKMLRINSDGSIPSDNPFFATATNKHRAIWALGLRNPFTFAVQPVTGRIFINDVGSDKFEEVNDGVAGANYGWPESEGPTTDPRFTSPIFAYARTAPLCAISGGAFYNPSTAQFPDPYPDAYFFADVCGHLIQSLAAPYANGTPGTFATGIWNPVDLDLGSDGALYHLSRASGAVARLTWSAPTMPTITLNPSDTRVSVGQPATFECSAEGSGPLSFQWEGNGVDIPSATFASHTIPSTTLSDDGLVLRCKVTNALGSATSTPATLSVSTRMPPTVRINSPSAGTTYVGGHRIRFSGTADDLEDGPLSDSRYSWRVDFHHNDHLHPFVPTTNGIRGSSFVVPTTGEFATTVFYRIHLTVEDSDGMTATTFVDVTPVIGTLILESEPSGLTITLGGQPYITPASVPSVVGMTRVVSVAPEQTLGQVPYAFEQWTHGGDREQAVTVSTGQTIFRAEFVANPN